MELLGRRPSEGDSEKLLGTEFRPDLKPVNYRILGRCMRSHSLVTAPCVAWCRSIHTHCSSHPPPSTHQWVPGTEWGGTWAFTRDHCPLNTFQDVEAEGRSPADVIQLLWNQTRHHDAAKGLLNSTLEGGDHRWVSYMVQRTLRGRKRDVKCLKSILI